MRLLLGLLIFGLWASFARYYYVCKIKGLCDKVEIEATPNRLQNLSLQYGDDNILQGYNQFYFKPNISQPTLDSSNYQFLEKIAGYMFDSTDTKLKIIGKYLESEKDVSAGTFENIGVARADAIRKELQKYGIAEDRISLEPSMVEGDVLDEPIDFLLLNVSDTEFEDAQFTFENMTYFESNFKSDSDVFEPGDAFLLYADSMATFFELKPEKTLTIIGHTDETGSKSHNKDLGLRRAKSARAFLVSDKGIENEITVKTMGEKKPLATNKTKAGRAKNRRVNFVIE